MATRKTRRALLAAAAGAVVAAVVVGALVEDRRERARPAQPLERRAGYQEHKRACLAPRAGDDRRGTERERSCRAWQAMLAEERERLAREGDRAAPSPR